ncbi:MAG: antibiotic biosynthesis monooxygenase family protein [Pseudomonadota bacterium]
MTFANLKATAAAAMFAVTGVPALADNGSEITLTYIWTAHEGQEERLVATYGTVGEILEANEPGLIAYEIAVSETGNQIVIHEVFEDGDALAFHLSETAAQFFPQLVEFATPGPFIFRGDVPEELKAASYGMNMGAIFTGDWGGFERE